MPTVVSGYRSATPTGIASQRLVIEMQDKIYQYDPSKTPMLHFLSMSAEGSKASAAVYNHLEDEPLPSWGTLGANLSSGATISITVADSTFIRPGDLIVIPTSIVAGKPEVLYANGTPADATHFTAIRDWAQVNGGVGGTAALSGANFVVIGNVNAEGTGTRTMMQTTEAAIQNFCQIIKTPWGITGTLDATTTYGGPDRVTQAQKAATEHAFEQERTFLFGQKNSRTDATTSRAIRSTGGIYYWLTTNSVNAGGTLTHATMETLCEKVFRYGSSTKVMLCSRRVMSQLDNIAEARLETVARQDTYGVQMKRYVSGHGELLVKIHDLLINDYAGSAIVVDMANIQKRFTVNQDGKRDALLRMNIQLPEEDAVKNEYLSEVGLHVHLEKTHGLLTGVA